MVAIPNEFDHIDVATRGIADAPTLLVGELGRVMGWLPAEARRGKAQASLLKRLGVGKT